METAPMASALSKFPARLSPTCGLAIALGKSNGCASSAEGAFADDLVGGGTCTDALLMGNFQVDRVKRKPERRNISDI
jgi:hypothetical protein